LRFSFLLNRLNKGTASLLYPLGIMSVETADTAFQKGNAAFVDEQFESALRHYSTAIDLEPDNGEFWVKRAACYFQLKNFAGARC
jgi:Flp pilus assembly protein TadD